MKVICLNLLPFWELIYIYIYISHPKALLKRIFTFPVVGYVSFLEGSSSFRKWSSKNIHQQVSTSITTHICASCWRTGLFCQCNMQPQVYTNIEMKHSIKTPEMTLFIFPCRIDKMEATTWLCVSINYKLPVRSGDINRHHYTLSPMSPMSPIPLGSMTVSPARKVPCPATCRTCFLDSSKFIAKWTKHPSVNKPSMCLQ